MMNIFLLPWKLAAKIDRIIRSAIYTSSIDAGGGSFDCRSPFFRLKISKHPTATLEVTGRIGCESFLGGNEVASISLEEGSKLIIEGDFDLGNGVRIACAPGATIRIGGRKLESGSGITACTTILCRKHITIGCDFICSWNVLIADYDLHYIEGSKLQDDVVIDDSVWISQGATILKGAEIGAGSIVACNSVVTQGKYAPKSLLAGAPARIKRESVSWKRDLPVE